MHCTQYGTRARYWRSASIATIQPMTVSSRTTTPVPQMLRVAEQRGAHDLQVVQQRVEFDDLSPAVGALLELLGLVGIVDPPRPEAIT